MADVQSQMALNVAQHIEKQIDTQLHQMSQLNDNDINELRRQRVKQLQQRSLNEQKWRTLGHGTYSEIGDQKEWFEATKTSERVVCHFYRSETWRCEIVDKHLTQLAPKHLETRFIKINVANCPFICERLNIVVLPALVLTNNNVTAGIIEGFDELGGRDDFPTLTLEKKLAEKGVIEYEEPPAAVLNKNKKPVGKSIRKGGGNVVGLRRGKGYDSDDSEYSDED